LCEHISAVDVDVSVVHNGRYVSSTRTDGSTVDAIVQSTDVEELSESVDIYEPHNAILTKDAQNLRKTPTKIIVIHLLHVLRNI